LDDPTPVCNGDERCTAAGRLRLLDLPQKAADDVEIALSLLEYGRVRAVLEDDLARIGRPCARVAAIASVERS